MATEPRARQREAFGGINWGAGFFGWLVAVGLGALLTALLAAAGAAVTLGEVDVDLEAEELGIGGAIGLLVIGLIAYFAGGYVAGRMSRFDGPLQGLGVWLWALIAAIVLALLGWLADEEYNLLAQLDLPRIPVEEAPTGLAIGTLVVIALGTLAAAMGGGALGVAYHGKVDDAAVAPPPDDPARREEPPPRRTDEPPPRADEPPRGEPPPPRE